MVGIARPQPNPKGPLPAPESYERLSSGPKPERPGLAAMGIASEAVPFAALTANFSPIPRTAPPALGRERGGSGPWAGASSLRPTPSRAPKPEVASWADDASPLGPASREPGGRGR